MLPAAGALPGERSVRLVPGSGARPGPRGPLAPPEAPGTRGSGRAGGAERARPGRSGAARASPAVPGPVPGCPGQERLGSPGRAAASWPGTWDGTAWPSPGVLPVGARRG